MESLTYAAPSCQNHHLSVRRYKTTGKCVECIREASARRTKSYNLRTNFSSVRKFRQNPVKRRHELDLDNIRRRQFGLAKDAAKSARRRAFKLQATPVWSEASQIKQIYEAGNYLTRLTGIKWDVDHEIPLKSNLVCGLHVFENLQLLTHVDNVRKGNKIVVPSSRAEGFRFCLQTGLTSDA